MKTSFEDKHKKLTQEVYEAIEKLINKKGEESRFRNCQVLKVKSDELQFNLDGRRYLVEITNDRLLDNNGYEYHFSALSLEQLCELVDSF